MIIEAERERESVCIVSHQAVLRVIYAYFMNIPQEQIPQLEMPLHVLIELTPMPDGTMHEARFPVSIGEKVPELAHTPAPAQCRPAGLYASASAPVDANISV